MPIQSGDVKLLKSAVMADVPEGGGAPTGMVIEDGISNSIFPDISELDRAGGRVSLRKSFVAIQTDDTDTYFGGNVIVAEPPEDPRVSVTLFPAASTFERRADATIRIEAYLTKGGEYPGFLYENHIAGQRLIQLFQRPETPLPAVGQSLVIVQGEDTPSEKAQYVRVTAVTSVVRKFYWGETGQSADYEARVVTCEISDALRTNFSGSPASRTFGRASSGSRVRETIVADAGLYSGVVPLTRAAALGDYTLKGASIYTQLVPSAQTETPIVNAQASGQSNALIDASNGSLSLTTSVPFDPSTNVYLGSPVLPGTLAIQYAGGSFTDSGGIVFYNANPVGTIQYASGTIAWSSAMTSYSGTKTVTFKAAGAPVKLADTAAIAVDESSRSYNYVLTIDPPPAPGTVKVSYLAQGRWYDLTDNGAGSLSGTDVAFGAGTVSYSSGTVAVTLGALPDMDSSVLFYWGATVNHFNRAALASPSVRFALSLGQAGVTPGSLTLSWNDGSPRTASDDGMGKITGSATGTIRYQDGTLELIPSALPAGGQAFEASFTYGPPETQDFPAPLRNGDGTVSLLLAAGNVLPGTVELTWNLLIEDYAAISLVPQEMLLVPNRVDPYKTVRDDGLGMLKDSQGVVFGSIDYAAGAITFTADTTVQIPFPRYSVTQIGTTMVMTAPGFGRLEPVYRNTFSGFEYKPAAAFMPYDETGLAKVQYRTASSSTTAAVTLTLSELAVDLTPGFAETIVPGSVNFHLGGKRYFDRNGRLYVDLDLRTDAATLAGSLDYDSGVATLSHWVPAQANSLVMRSLLTSLDGQPVDEVVFRIPVVPVRPGSVQMLATTLNGAQVNVTADTSGLLTGTNVTGQVDYETGIVRARFGRRVTAAGNEAEVWYDPQAVDAEGKIFRPYPVFADSIRYNAVSFSYLPLDASLLGIDPVRLPSDGRVPVFRPGGFGVVGHTGRLTSSVSNGQIVSCGRVRLSRVRVVGNDKVVIHAGYTADLEAGTVTFTDTSGYAQPVTIEHRVEDMGVIRDVQINGDITFTRALTHDYPLTDPPTSFMSSALVAGDLFARVPVIFDQATWNGAWKDVQEGSAATATFNATQYPITVTNRGAITERWVVRFTNTVNFEVIGENVGVIATGEVSTTCAPTNPATGVPYFQIPALGWGNGWATGNVLRFNTIGAQFPVWVVRTVQQGPETVAHDDFTLLIRGDVDTP